MDEPSNLSGTKFWDFFETGNNNVIQINTEDVFFQQVIKEAQYLPENEKNNDVVGNIISGWLKKKKRLNVVKWEPNNQNYPRFMLLGTDRGILAYIEFFYHRSDVDVSDEVVRKIGICHILTDLRKRLSLVDSDLDRPVFYVHILDYKRQKGIFFETTEMIKNNIFENKESIYKYVPKDLYFSKITEMGDFEELISIFKNLKKNNVKFY